jgi:hypothetical protein
LVRHHPNLLAVRPAVVSAVSGVIGGDAFASPFRRGVRNVHGAVFRRVQDAITLTIVDVGRGGHLAAMIWAASRTH